MDKGKYTFFEEFLADVQLVWSNCKAYNQSGSEIYRLAEAMDRRGKKLAKELRANLKLDAKEEPPAAEEEEEEDDDFGFDPERYVPFDEKAEFAEQIKRVTKEGLT